jgi:hypothetical protein
MICDISYLIIRRFLPLCSSILFKKERERDTFSWRVREKVVVEDDVIFVGHNILFFLTNLIYKNTSSSFLLFQTKKPNIVS